MKISSELKSADFWKLSYLRSRKVVLVNGETNSSCGMKSLWKLVWSFSCSAVWKQLLKEKRCYHHVVWQKMLCRRMKLLEQNLKIVLRGYFFSETSVEWFHSDADFFSFGLWLLLKSVSAMAMNLAIEKLMFIVEIFDRIFSSRRPLILIWKCLQLLFISQELRFLGNKLAKRIR